MFEQAFKNIDDVLWKDAGCTSELDYTEQTSWLLFLKYLDALENDKATEASLDGKKYTHILDQPYRWETWAAPKDKAGKIDHNTALSGDDLIAFVNAKLFPYLHGFKAKATGPNTIEYKIGEIFGEIKNRIQSGYNLREIIDHIDELRFQSQTEKHELSHLYEAKIKNMGNAGRNGGEYYTPRPLIRAIVAVTAPRLGETICDPAVGRDDRGVADGLADVLHRSGTAVGVEVQSFIRELAEREVDRDTSRRVLALERRQALIASLNDTLHAFVATFSELRRGPALEGGFANNLAESLNTLLLSAIDAVRDREPAEVDLLLRMTSDRGDLMERLRRNLLSGPQPLDHQQKSHLFYLTSLFERTVWLLRQLGLVQQSLDPSPPADTKS